MIEPTCASGWNRARSSNHMSRGRTHCTSSGATPWSSSHRQASIPVFPAPSTTYRDAGSAGSTNPLTGTTRASWPTVNEGVCREGT
jgi:hypothetical protein